MDQNYYDALTPNQRKCYDFLQKGRSPIEIAEKAILGRRVYGGPVVNWTPKQREVVRWLLRDQRPYACDAKGRPDADIAAYEDKHGRTGNNLGPVRLVYHLLLHTVFGDVEDPWPVMEKIYDTEEYRTDPLAWLRWGQNRHPEDLTYRLSFDLQAARSLREVEGL